MISSIHSGIVGLVVRVIGLTSHVHGDDRVIPDINDLGDFCQPDSFSHTCMTLSPLGPDKPAICYFSRIAWIIDCPCREYKAELEDATAAAWVGKKEGCA